MRSIVLDSRPKWRRRLSRHRLPGRVVIITTALYMAGRDILLFPLECRDTLASYIEELA